MSCFHKFYVSQQIFIGVCNHRQYTCIYVYTYVTDQYTYTHIYTHICISIYLYHCCSVAKSYTTLCNPMDCRTPGFPVLHCLLEFAQTHVH